MRTLNRYGRLERILSPWWGLSCRRRMSSPRSGVFCRIRPLADPISSLRVNLGYYRAVRDFSRSLCLLLLLSVAAAAQTAPASDSAVLAEAVEWIRASSKTSAQYDYSM